MEIIGFIHHGDSHDTVFHLLHLYSSPCPRLKEKWNTMQHSFLRLFLVHKDRLPSPDQIPGTIMSPTSILFIMFLALVIVISSRYVARRPRLARPVFISLWCFFLLTEVLVILFDSLGGADRGMDWVNELPLYPCSLYLYSMPFVIWGRGKARWMASAYVCTLGLVGGIVNFIYPIQLLHYSCFSFIGMHSLLYHGNLIFTFLVLISSGDFSYGGIDDGRYLVLASVPTLLQSIPANLLNYSAIHSDYMYFTGAFPLLGMLFPNAPRVGVTLFMYALYIFVPMLFFLPSQKNLRRRADISEQV